MERPLLLRKQEDQLSGEQSSTPEYNFALREEIKATVRQSLIQLKAEWKAELRAELRAELMTEFEEYLKPELKAG
jgi:hypothetical protein